MDNTNTTLSLPLPLQYDTYDTETKNNIIAYLNQLDEKEICIYKIAIEHLETSFNVVKSNGFIKWLKEK